MPKTRRQGEGRRAAIWQGAAAAPPSCSAAAGPEPGATRGQPHAAGPQTVASHLKTSAQQSRPSGTNYGAARGSSAACRAPGRAAEATAFSGGGCGWREDTGMGGGSARSGTLACCGGCWVLPRRAGVAAATPIANAPRGGRISACRGGSGSSRGCSSATGICTSCASLLHACVAAACAALAANLAAIARSWAC